MLQMNMTILMGKITLHSMTIAAIATAAGAADDRPKKSKEFEVIAP